MASENTCLFYVHFSPVIVAHRNYVEQGARRKAREWARWGLFGFLFYFALSVLAYLLPLRSN
jgi:hypothetical protein